MMARYLYTSFGMWVKAVIEISQVGVLGRKQTWGSRLVAFMKPKSC